MRGLLLLLSCLCAVIGSASGQESPFLDGSVKDLEFWARKDTNDAQGYYYLALAHWKHHHWRQTDSLLRLAVRLEPRYPAAYFALYFLPYARRSSLAKEEMRGRVPAAWRPAVEEARRFYQRAFRTDPLLSMEVMRVVYDIKEPRVRNESEYRIYLQYYAWFVDLGLGRYRMAHARLRQLAELEFDEVNHPDSVPTYILWYRGLAAAHSSQYDAAIADFRSLLQRAVKQEQRDEFIRVPLRDNEYRFMLAYLHHIAGHADSAIALYQQSLERDLGLVMAHTYLASIYESAGRAEDALLERRRAAEIDSDDPTALFDLAASLFNGGQLAEAGELLHQAIALNERYSPSYYLLARADDELGRPAQAREGYTRFLALAPLRLHALRADAQERLAKLPQ